MFKNFYLFSFILRKIKWQINVIFNILLISTMLPLAHGANILILSTDEMDAPQNQYEGAIRNIVSEFEDGGSNEVDLKEILTIPNSINQSTFQKIDNGKYDVTLIMTTYHAIHESNLGPLREAVNSRYSNTFVFFIDGCCNDLNDNVQNLISLINNINNQSQVAKGEEYSDYFDSFLNTDSEFSSSFTALNPLHAGYVTYITGAKSNNILYLPNRIRPPVSDGSSALGIFFPRSEINNGQGSCLFAVLDATIFIDYVYPRNQGKIASSFVNAATSPGGTCGIAGAVSKNFNPNSIEIGDESDLTIRISNLSKDTATNINLIDNIPNPLEIIGTPTTNCGTNGSLQINGPIVSYTGGSLPASINNPNGTTEPSSCEIFIKVKWPNNAPGASKCYSDTNYVINRIVPGEGLSTAQGQIGDVAEDTLTCISEPPEITEVHQVPINRNLIVITIFLLLFLYLFGRRKSFF